MLSRIATVCSLALLATLSNAIVVTEPTSLDIWTSTGPNQIAWQNEVGDPAAITLQLIHNNDSTALPADGIFASLVPIDTDIFVFSPACLPGFPDNGVRLPNGTGFQVRFISSNSTGNGTVLATSEMFRIEPAASAAACATGGGLSVGGSSTATSATAGSTGAGASGSLSTRSHTGAIVGGTIAGVLALLIIAGVGVWLRKRRRDTRRETMAYALRLQDRMNLTASDGKAGQAEQAGA